MVAIGPRQLIREMQEQMKKKEDAAVKASEDTYKVDIKNTDLYVRFRQRCEKELIDVSDKIEELIERHMVGYNDGKIF